MSEKLIFPIGFDLEEGVKEASKEWKSTYQKQLQKAIDDKPLKVKIDFESKGIDTKEFKQWMALSREAEKLERERIKNAKEWQKVADQAAMAETRRANATNESNARIERANREAEASERRKRDAVERTNAAYNSQSTYLTRLLTRMAAYFSIHQAMSFLSNIREVTAEFEMQRVSLGALIQDAQKANMIFEQIKMQAVKSPYEVQDLVRYTKQLAAYGIEADELISTMNQLADISAGLGTEMDRIILAYGQIQAAGVLKGTELRQLTELGLPMVELLADYYSTLRDEVVTTSEVFDMISNKEIPFEDVQAILEALTSEGGRFYEMQATQAETLQGYWANLKDTLSLMFDEIGRSEAVQGLLRGFIDHTKVLARNWNEIWQAIKVVGLTYGGLKAGATIMRVIGTTTMTAEIAQRKYELATKQASKAMASQGRIAGIFSKRLQYVALCQMKAAKATNVLTRSFYKLGAVIMANPVAAITTLVGVIAGFVAYTKSAGEEVKTFEDEQKEYYDGVVKDIGLTVDKFKKLAQMAVTYAEGSEMQQQALQNLKDQFGDMFPEYQLTLEYLRGLVEETGNVSTAFDSMGQSIQASMVAKLRQDLIDREYEQLNTQFANLFEMARGGSFQFIDKLPLMVKYIEEGKDQLEAMKLAIGDIVIPGRLVIEQSEKGVISRAATLSDMDFDKLKAALTDLPVDSELRKELEAIYNYLQALRALDDKINDINKDASEFEGTYKDVNVVVERAGRHLDTHPQSWIDQYAKPLALLDILKAGLSDDDYQSIRDNLIKKFGSVLPSWDEFMSVYSDGKLFGKQLSAEAIYGITQLKKVFGIYNEEWRNFLSRQEGFVGGEKIEVFTNREIENFGSLYDAVKKTSKAYEDTYETLKEYKKLRSQTDKEEAIAFYDKQIAKLEEQNRQRKAFLDEYGSLVKSDKDDNKALKERQTLLKDELSTVEKIYKEYQGLRKYMSEADAQATINKMFGSVPFEILGMATSFKEMKEQLNKALKEAKRLGDTKLAMDIEYKIGKLDADEIRKNMEKELKRISDELSRTKTAKEFFDRMLGLTGDKQLSASLTVSIYGGVSSDMLGETLAKDMATKFRKQVQSYFGNIDIESAINKTTGEIEPIALEKLLTDENIKALGEDNVKEIRKIIADLVSANAKYWDDLMKDLERARTYGDKLVKVYETTQERIAKVNAREDLDANAKKLLIDQINELQEKEMQKLQYEAFKDSPMYVAMFENLDTTSASMLTNMRNHLVKLQSEWKNLDPTQLKEMQSRINEIDKQLSARNPFKSIVDGIKEFDTLQKSGSRKDAEEALAYAAERRLHAERRYQQAVADGESDEEIKRLASLLDRCVEAENEAAKKMSEWDDATQKVVQGINDLQQVVNLVQATTSAVNDIVNAFGGWGDAADEEFWNTMIDGINGLMSGAQSVGTGIAQIMSGDIIGGATSLISGIGSIVSSITNLAYAGTIKRANQEIERQQELLDNLSYSYGRLQQEAEKAFGTEYIQNYQRQLDNLEAQVEAYEKQLDLERSKGKKSDEEKIKEYQEQIRDTKDAIEDMYGSLSEHFLGQDLTSAARDFASAWIDAYKEFANTTDTMKAKFQEMIQNMIVESLIAKVMERALKPVFDMVDNMGDTDFYSNSFWSQLMTEMNKATENGVVGAERIMQMFEQMGANLRDTGAGLTGISRDIASASEESILGLAAGINTQNFYISQVPTKLDTIIGLLRGDSAVVDSGVNVQDLITIQNQFLSHLPTIAQNTAETVARCERAAVACESMASKLGSVIKPKGTTSTHSVNVTIGS